MKLVSYQRNDETRIGAAINKEQDVVDLRRALSRLLASEGDEQAAKHAEALIPGDMTEFLRGGNVSMNYARQALEYVTKQSQGQDITYPLAQVQLLAPVPRPPKVIGIGGNFPHLTKTWPVPPAVPPVFQRATSSIVPPGSDIPIPPNIKYLQAEMELCVIIGRRCHRIAKKDAYSYVAGYTIGNDLSEIDVLMTQWVTRKRPDIAELGLPTEAPYNLGLAFQSKCWDRSAPMGPYLVTSDEIDPDNVDYEFKLNGEVLQSGSSSEMLVKIPRIIEYLSSVLTLEPGDVIFSGARGHVRPLVPGDVIGHKISGLGSFDCRVVKDPASA